MRKIFCFILLFINVSLGFSNNDSNNKVLFLKTIDSVYKVCAGSVSLQEEEVLFVELFRTLSENNTCCCKVKILSRKYDCPIDFIDGLKKIDNGFILQFSFCSGYYFVKSDITFIYDSTIRDFICSSYVEQYINRLNPDRIVESQTYNTCKVRLSEFTEETLYLIKNEDRKVSSAP